MTHREPEIDLTPTPGCQLCNGHKEACGYCLADRRSLWRLENPPEPKQPAEIPRLEELAAAEHDSWARWTQWMLAEMTQGIADLEKPIAERNLLRKILLGLDCVRRWRLQVETNYTDLSEKEKESDRKVVREKWGAYLAAAEDLFDSQYIKEALADPENQPTIPWEQVKAELGLNPSPKDKE